MKLFPTGKDAQFYKQLIPAAFFVSLFSVIKNTYPDLIYVIGFFSILGFSAYYIYKYIHKRKNKNENSN